DVDDSACVAATLRACGRSVPNENVEVLTCASNDDGTFFTWLYPRTPAQREVWRRHGAVAPRRGVLTLALAKFLDDKDCVVAANAIWYLGERAQTVKTIEHLCEIATTRLRSPPCTYYPDPLALCYAISRAYSSGVLALEPSRAPIIDYVLSR